MLAWSCRISFVRRLNENEGLLRPTGMLLPEEIVYDWVALMASWIVINCGLKESTYTVSSKESEILPNVRSRSKSTSCGEVVSRTWKLGVSNNESTEARLASTIGVIRFPAMSETSVELNRIQHWNWDCPHSPSWALIAFKSKVVKLMVIVSLL